MTYKEYIHNIIKTRGQYNCQGYFERHHIIPKCLGGKGDARTKHENIIWLYPREHFEAHRLLALEHSDNYSLVYAFHMMSTMSKDEMIVKYNLTTNMWKKLVRNNGYGWKNCGSSHLSEIERRYIKNE